MKKITDVFKRKTLNACVILLISSNIINLEQESKIILNAEKGLEKETVKKEYGKKRQKKDEMRQKISGFRKRTNIYTADRFTVTSISYLKLSFKFVYVSFPNVIYSSLGFLYLLIQALYSFKIH